MHLKKSIFILFLLVTFSTYSQKEKFNKTSIEVGTGLHVPLAPNDKISRSNYVNFGSFEIGFRYMFNQKLGAKLKYAYNGFRDKNDTDTGINNNTIAVEGFYNVGRLVLPYYIYNKATIFFHTGVGYTRATALGINVTEQTGNINFGFRPQVKINDWFSVFADGNYNLVFKQHYSYSGELLSPDYEDQNGSFATLNFGVIFSLGKNKHHVDWY